MNPLAALIAMMLALKNAIQSRFNAAMAKLPPMESMEAGSAGQAVMRELDWARNCIEQLGTDLESTLNAAGTIITGFERKVGETVELAAARLIDCMKAEAAAGAISAAIAAKTHLPFVDHETAIADAKIEYSGLGVLGDIQRPGWLVRILDWISPI